MYAWYICMCVTVFIYLWYVSINLCTVHWAVSIQLCYSLCILTGSPYSISQFQGLGVYQLFEKHCAACFVYFIILYYSLWWIFIKTEEEVALFVQVPTKPHWFPGSGYLYKAQHDLRYKFLRVLIFASITFVTKYRICFLWKCLRKYPVYNSNMLYSNLMDIAGGMLATSIVHCGFGFPIFAPFFINTFQQGHWKAPCTFYS